MYRYQYDLMRNTKIYIAGPECFYTHGYDMLAAMKKRAEALGFQVTLPNDHPLDLDNPDLRKRADSIFADLKRVMLETTAIVADLEAYRGCEPDSGTIYEIGMAFAKGARCYGYTRDKRSMAVKNQQSYLKDGQVWDERGELMPYAQLPFSPLVVGSTKIIEGDFDDCLKMLMTDREEAYKSDALRKELIDRGCTVTQKEKTRPLVYLAGLERYQADGKEKLARMKELCIRAGWDAVTPLDPAPGVKEKHTDNPYGMAAYILDNCQQHVRNCDIILADLNNFRGYEVSNDVGFECGMAFQLGKKMYGYMDNTDKCIHKIPNLGQEGEFRDQAGSNVENFDYPANLMFGSSMKIWQGDFASALEKSVKDWNA